MREAAKHELFMTIASTINYTVPDTNVSSERVLESTNSLVNPTNPLYPGDWGYEYAKGIKTGHTNDAGYCLASSAKKDGVKLLSVVLKSEAYQQDDGSWYYGNFADTRTLFEWGFNNFSYRDVLKSTETVTELLVAMGADADTVYGRPSTTIRAFLPNDVDLTAVERTITLSPDVAADGLTAPVSAGQVVGEISVIRDGVVLGTSPLVTTTSVDLSRVEYMKDQLRERCARRASFSRSGRWCCSLPRTFSLWCVTAQSAARTRSGWSSRAPSGSIWRTTRKSCGMSAASAPRPARRAAAAART